MSDSKSNSNEKGSESITTEDLGAAEGSSDGATEPSVTSADPDLEADGSIGLTTWFHDLTWNEAHLLVLGLYAGFVAVRPKPRHTPVGRLNWEKNEWYWKGAYILGYLLKLFLVGTLGVENAVPVLKDVLGSMLQAPALLY